MVSRWRSRNSLLLAGYALVTVSIYFVLVPYFALAGNGSRALRYLVVGWVPYTLFFYAAGRFFSSPTDLPNMRAADVGLGLFLVLLLLSLGLEAWGFTPEAIPEAHVLQAIGIFVGLALFGWSIGRRSKAITQHTSAE